MARPTPSCIKRYHVDGGIVARLEPVLCLRRYKVNGGIVAVLEPARSTKER